MILLLLVYVCLARAAIFSDPDNMIGITLPSYAKASGFKMGFLKALFYLGLAVFALLPFSKLVKFQIISLVVVSCCLMCKHLLIDYAVIFDWVPGGDFVVTILLVLLAIVLAFLSLNVKSRRLFGSIGGGYVLIYMIMLIMSIPSLTTFIVFFVIAIVLLILLGKFDEFKFNCMIKTINVPFLIACFANQAFRYKIFDQMHSVKSYAFTVWMGRLFFILTMAVVSLYVFFQDKVTEKVSSMTSRDKKEEEKPKDEADGSENV